MDLGKLVSHVPRKQGKQAVSRRQEESAAKRYGGRRVKGSGSGLTKGDVRLDVGMLLEAKHRHALPAGWVAILAKATAEAIVVGRDPVVEIEVEGMRGVERRWVMLPSSVFERMVRVVGDRGDRDDGEGDGAVSDDG